MSVLHSVSTVLYFPEFIVVFIKFTLGKGNVLNKGN